MKKYSVCIVGGGSTFTLGFLKSFCRMKEQFPLKKLVLFDIDAERQEPIGEFGKILFKEQFPELDFSYTTDIKEAYEGMDFVFMQMRAGGLPMRAKDEHIPLSMGLIGQETCGAGGMAYGLRSCVDMIKAVHDIRNYAPEAWILNYSNPAAIVAEALRREFPDDKKILNICDQPENVVRSCSRLLGCDWENLDPVYFGLNHYGWFTNIYVNMIFGFSATMFPLFVVQTYKLAIKSRLVIVTTAIAYINIVISLISIFMFIRNRNEKNQYYLDSIMKDKTLKLQEDYYKKIIDNYSNIRKFKHDIKGHLAVVNELINSKNYDEANVYIGNMSEAITGKDIYNTNNIYISSILNSFDQSFIDNKIEFDLSYYIISDLKMNSMDICSLFYNLILNAVEANLKIEDKRFIKLYIANIKNNVLIKIVNPVDENFNLDIIKENKTTKEDKENHGFGLITINNIISKYNGNIDYSIHDQYLIADITILNVL